MRHFVGMSWACRRALRRHSVDTLGQVHRLCRRYSERHSEGTPRALREAVAVTGDMSCGHVEHVEKMHQNEPKVPQKPLVVRCN